MCSASGGGLSPLWPLNQGLCPWTPLSRASCKGDGDKLPPIWAWGNNPPDDPVLA